MDPGTGQDGALPGRTLGSYRIERLLGRGGMGAVFLAYDASLHRHVALKVVADAAGDASSQTQLVREARSAAALNHPAICTIHEVGNADGTPFIAMEYVDGRSLSDRLREGALPVDLAMRYGLQAADALAYAHEHGVIHRDFKAANAIVTPTGQLKIIDFGLARRGDALAGGATTVLSVVPAGMVAGTPYAMAPEQVRGENADARTDIWALGVLLYEVLAGSKPFSAATTPELFSAILRDVPAPLPARVPVAARAIIDRCLAKEPQQRYQHASEVRAALEAVQAGTTPAWSAWRYHASRRRWLWPAALAAVTAAVLVGLNVGGARDRIAGTPPAAPIRLAVLPFENLTGDPDQEYFSDGLTEEMITQLGRLHPQRLNVIARTSSMRYKHSQAPLDTIGRELGVDYLLEGSARREGNRVRISATLIRVSDQTQRWTDTFERDLAGILALQNDVARGVAESLTLTLLPPVQARLAGAAPVNPEAYEAYLKGTGHQTKLTRADLDRAMEYFELARAKDPNFALAYVGIAGVWSARQQMQFVTPAIAAPQLRAATTKAFELDSTLAEVHFRLAELHAWTEWDWPAAEPEFRRAIELRPSYAEARAFYSHYLFIMNRPAEAMEQITRAIELDPLSEIIQSLYGVDLTFVRRYDEAIVQFRSALNTAPGSPVALNGLARAFHNAERYAEAFAAEQNLWAARGDAEMGAALTRGYSEAGYRGGMRAAADTLAARALRTNAAPFTIAHLYLRAAEIDRTFEWVERSFAARDPNVPYVGILPYWDVVRDDPRLADLLRRLNRPSGTP